MPPAGRPLAKLSAELGISESCLYNWRLQARKKGLLVPDSNKKSEQWSSANKFSVVLETARMTEAELSAYCRQKGLFVEQVTAWRQACEVANDRIESASANSRQTSKADKKRIQDLETELQRKEKALAEVAALLVLRKKLDAFYHESEDK